MAWRQAQPPFRPHPEEHPCKSIDLHGWSRRMGGPRSARGLMLRDASQRDGAREASESASRCDAPQHEAEPGRSQMRQPCPRRKPRRRMRGRGIGGRVIEAAWVGACGPSGSHLHADYLHGRRTDLGPLGDLPHPWAARLTLRPCPRQARRDGRSLHIDSRIVIGFGLYSTTSPAEALPQAPVAERLRSAPACNRGEREWPIPSRTVCLHRCRPTTSNC